MQLFSILFAFLLPFSCGKGDASKDELSKTASFIHDIGSTEEFDNIMKGSGDRLIAFDLYANWCMPCRILSPLLEKIAAANASRVTFFKVNLEKLPDLAQTFGVNGIPHVAFVKNKVLVDAVVGIQPAQTYIDVINRNAGK